MKLQLPTKGPLEGIRILDCTIWQAGPTAGALLGDMGADVIKIEPPIVGDPARGLIEIGSPPKGVGAYFEATNRNKRSITINLKSPEGKALFYRLCHTADVVMHNFKVGVAKRLGIDHDSIREHKADIITAIATGLGSKGEDAKRGVFDILGLARSGAMDALRYPGQQNNYMSGFGLADQTGALILTQGITLALLARERFGIGQAVEVSQLGSMMLLQQLGITRQLINGVPVPKPLRTQSNNPMFSVYPANNGKWFAIGGLQPDRYWPDVCEIIERRELTDDPRFCDLAARNENSEALVAILDSIFILQPRDYWLSRLNQRDIPCAPINDYEDLTTDCQVISNELITTVEHPTAGPIPAVGIPIKLSSTPGAIQNSAPEMGQHTETLLMEEGFSWEEIETLKDKGAI